MTGSPKRHVPTRFALENLVQHCVGWTAVGWKSELAIPYGKYITDAAVAFDRNFNGTGWESKFRRDFEFDWMMNEVMPRVIVKQNIQVFRSGKNMDRYRILLSARQILVDPFGPDGQPIYASVRELTGLNPP